MQEPETAIISDQLYLNIRDNQLIIAHTLINYPKL